MWIKQEIWGVYAQYQNYTLLSRYIFSHADRKIETNFKMSQLLKSIE